MRRPFAARRREGRSLPWSPPGASHRPDLPPRVWALTSSPSWLYHRGQSASSTTARPRSRPARACAWSARRRADAHHTPPRHPRSSPEPGPPPAAAHPSIPTSCPGRESRAPARLTRRRARARSHRDEPASRLSEDMRISCMRRSALWRTIRGPIRHLASPCCRARPLTAGLSSSPDRHRHERELGELAALRATWQATLWGSTHGARSPFSRARTPPRRHRHHRELQDPARGGAASLKSRLAQTAAVEEPANRPHPGGIGTAVWYGRAPLWEMYASLEPGKSPPEPGEESRPTGCASPSKTPAVIPLHLLIWLALGGPSHLSVRRGKRSGEIPRSPTRSVCSSSRSPPRC